MTAAKLPVGPARSRRALATLMLLLTAAAYRPRLPLKSLYLLTCTAEEIGFQPNAMPESRGVLVKAAGLEIEVCRLTPRSNRCYR